eukprot:1154173-Pelagomonas_calceolata.AAC.4
MAYALPFLLLQFPMCALWLLPATDKRRGEHMDFLVFIGCTPAERSLWHMQFLVSKGCTPAERFWAMPAVSATARSNAIAPLLGQDLKSLKSEATGKDLKFRAVSSRRGSSSTEAGLQARG